MGCACPKPKFIKIKNIKANNSLIYSTKEKKEYSLKIITSPGKKTQQFNDYIEILKRSFHPNIIQLKGIFISPQNRNIYIITEYADDGNLEIKLEEQKEKGEQFQENQIIDWLTQCCLALQYIHDENIIHRNIKPSNIFCMKMGYIKLGDFGIAKLLDKSINKTNTFFDNQKYLAPEIINKNPYSFEVDIWDLGITFYQLMYFSYPFEGKDINELYDNILEGKRAEPKNSFEFSDSLKEIINKMLSTRIEERIKIDEILNYPIIKARAEAYLIENNYEDNAANCKIENYEKLNIKQMNKEKKEPALLTEFYYDDENNINFKDYFSEDSKKLLEEKNNYQLLRLMTLIKETVVIRKKTTL